MSCCTRGEHAAGRFRTRQARIRRACAFAAGVPGDQVRDSPPWPAETAWMIASINKRSGLRPRTASRSLEHNDKATTRQ
eukprot:7767376-Alexandrium_andersonii.AAC.1